MPKNNLSAPFIRRLEASRKAAANKQASILETAGKLTTVLALVFGGIWTLWMYLDHSRQQERERTKQLRLENEAQQFSLEQARLLSKIDADQKRVSLESAGLDVTEKARRLEAEGQLRFTSSDDLDVKCGVFENHYDVVWKMTVVNTQENPLQVSLAVVNKYIGVLAPARGAKYHRGESDPPWSKLGIYDINDPPIALRGEATPGDVRWIHFGKQQVYVYENAIREMMTYFPSYREDILINGGGTGAVPKGGDSRFIANFEVISPPGNWVTVTESIALNKCPGGDCLWHFWDLSHLPPCKWRSGQQSTGSKELSGRSALGLAHEQRKN